MFVLAVTTIYAIVVSNTSDSELQSIHSEILPRRPRHRLEIEDFVRHSYDVLFVPVCTCYGTKQVGNSGILIIIAKVPNARCRKNVA